MESKFLWNPLKQIFAIGLTKFLSVHYFCVQNFNNSNMEESIYNNTCMF
jgi:hypothetical protein